ncbi:olfactory receptor 12D2-like [Rhinatrema bivittatum]|uniref:olfactory receptor 12D2-like n=1 Tax=Rhinatrema bivittatum TaxID=194408 RepID=UPI001126D3D1|nr:olfactory receptor 12D2-like [Rhinatrema bivittatum]
MEDENGTVVTEFILLGLTNVPELQIFLFALFSIFFKLSILGNATIIMLVVTEPRLHTPMYFLLANLSFLDISFSTITVPRMLVDFLSERQNISFLGCFIQLHLFQFVGGTEAIILTAMSYDRYVAICNPLHYNVIINKRVCILMALTAWTIGFLHALLHTVLTSRLPYCKSNKINHFFCDIKPLLKLACANTQLNENLLTIVTGIAALSTFFLTLTSYAYIISSLREIQTAHGKRKAFSTCASHLIVVLLFYGTAICTYMRPTSDQSVKQDRVAAVLFTVITPTMNPIIYTLRNKEVKNSLRKAMHKKFFPERM